MQLNSIKVIGFDADDTLWVNETFFREGEERFCDLLENFMPRHDILRSLFKVEIENLPLYGYGIKAFMLSMIETALQITDHKCDGKLIKAIIDIGRNQLHMPVEKLEGVEETIIALKEKYKLVVVTKGDLLDQERKLTKSGLASHFHHIEIVSEKNNEQYQKLLSHLDVKAEEFLMIGNSLKSDVLPILEIGGYGIHIPFHTTWEHEKVNFTVSHEKFLEVEKIKDILEYL
jgi:putative hydrolase of the HAD superfamily